MGLIIVHLVKIINLWLMYKKKEKANLAGTFTFDFYSETQVSFNVICNLGYMICSKHHWVLNNIKSSICLEERKRFYDKGERGGVRLYAKKKGKNRHIFGCQLWKYSSYTQLFKFSACCDTSLTVSLLKISKKKKIKITLLL